MDKSPEPGTTVPQPLKFRLRYALLPIIILLLAVAATVFFWPRLPGTLAYTFNDGEAGSTGGAGLVVAILLIPQFIAAGAAVLIAALVVALSRRYKGGDTRLLNTITAVMANMFALPQLVLFLAMLDIFSYNAYHVHVPFLPVSIGIMVLGIAVLCLIFVRSVRASAAHKQNIKNSGA